MNQSEYFAFADGLPEVDRFLMTLIMLELIDMGIPGDDAADMVFDMVTRVSES